MNCVLRLGSSAKSLAHLTMPMMLVTGCGELPAFQVGAKTDYQEQSSNPADFKNLDLLFVVDNSGSMADEQQHLANSFESFIEQFSERDLNFHIGVVSTDIRPGNTWTGAQSGSCGRPYQGIFNGGPGTLLSKYSAYKFLTPDVPNYINKFKNNVLLGTCGSGREMGIASAHAFLDPARLAPGGYNAGFVRDDAYLAVIIISDEDETRSNDDITYIKQFPTERTARVQGLKNRMLALKPETPEMLRVDAIVAPSLAQCPTVHVENGIVGVGEVYQEVALAMGGKVSNICSDFANDLVDIGTQILIQLTRFPLKQVPANSLVEVRVNGMLVPQDANNGWMLIDSAGQYFVEFRGGAIPKNGDKIGITYVPTAPTI